MITSGNGYPVWSGTFAPFGQEVSPQITSNHYKFTGKERDGESNLDYFGARYMSSTIGRFMTPDWSTEPEAVPYANFSDPQTLNLYGYVRNNPLSKTDPDGHCEIDGEQHTWVWCFAHALGITQTQKEKLNAARFYANEYAKTHKDFDPSKYTDQILDAYNHGAFWNNYSSDPLQVMGFLIGLPGGAPLVRDSTGKIHGDLPDHVPDNWTKEDLETAQHELRESIKAREAEQNQYGEEGGHRERIRREERLLRQVDKKLSGS